VEVLRARDARAEHGDFHQALSEPAQERDVRRDTPQQGVHRMRDQRAEHVRKGVQGKGEEGVERDVAGQ
jgi:hypothetical protein